MLWACIAHRTNGRRSADTTGRGGVRYSTGARRGHHALHFTHQQVRFAFGLCPPGSNATLQRGANRATSRAAVVFRSGVSDTPEAGERQSMHHIAVSHCSQFLAVLLAEQEGLSTAVLEALLGLATKHSAWCHRARALIAPASKCTCNCPGLLALAEPRASGGVRSHRPRFASRCVLLYHDGAWSRPHGCAMWLPGRLGTEFLEHAALFLEKSTSFFIIHALVRNSAKLAAAATSDAHAMRRSSCWRTRWSGTTPTWSATGLRCVLRSRLASPLRDQRLLGSLPAPHRSSSGTTRCSPTRAWTRPWSWSWTLPPRLCRARRVRISAPVCRPAVAPRRWVNSFCPPG
jgi:hypothetical protein